MKPWIASSSVTPRARAFSASALETLEPRTLFNGTIATADDIGTLAGERSFFDSVSTADDPSDYRRLRLDAPGRLSATLTRSRSFTGDANLYLYNSAGTPVASSTNGAGITDVIERQLNAGTYYVRVAAAGIGRTAGGMSYHLRLAADYAGDGLTLARNLGTLNNSQRVLNDAVNPGDPDFYRFSVTEAQDLNISASGLSGDLVLRLLDTAGNVISTVSNDANASVALPRREIGPGTYYVQLYGQRTNYSLSVSARPIPPDPAGDSLTTALEVGTLTGAALTVREFVGFHDLHDYYRFRVGQESTVNLSLRGLTNSANANLRLLNSSGTELAESISPDASEDISRRLPAGVYYAKVSSAFDTLYDVHFSATPITAPVSDDTLAGANELGVLSTQSNQGVSRVGHLGPIDTVDYFKFTLTEERLVSLSIAETAPSVANNDVDLAFTLLYPSGAPVIPTVDEDRTDPSTENVNDVRLGTGTYYVAVHFAAVNTGGNVDIDYLLSIAARTLPTT